MSLFAKGDAQHILSIYALCHASAYSVVRWLQPRFQLPYVITESIILIEHFFLDLHACFAASHDAVYLVEGSPTPKCTSLDLCIRSPSRETVFPR